MKIQKKITKQKGITLISLVITIVILLILAGVAVSITVNDNGVFKHAENATEKWNAKITEEQDEIDKILGYFGVQVSDEMPAGKGWDDGENATVDKVAIQGSRIAPIPKGYTVSQIPGEDSITGGMVVYQIPVDSTVDWTKNEITLKDEIKPVNLQENVNQYVWIPVDDINDMVMCKKNGTIGTAGSTKTCNLIYDVAENKIICETHGYTTSTELSDDQTSPNFIDTTGLAGRLYGMTATTTDVAKPKIYTTNMVFTNELKAEHKFSKDSDYREPDLVTDYDKDDVTTDDNTSNDYMKLAGVASANALKRQLNNKFIEMAKSVAKYGGFYISRFEPSLNLDNSQVISKKNKAVLTEKIPSETNKIAGERWYGLYNKTLNNVEKEESVNSHMIWGCQYDQVIKFLGKEKGETGHLYQTQMLENTGYYRVGFTGNTMVDQDILNNIYDLEGNYREWTAQAYNTDSRAYRGGYYNDADSSCYYPASTCRSNAPNSSLTRYFTARPTLYVK